jgi:AraC family transcriptional regulator of adaptative response / DNA-3-methyladenine glycosylase II
VAYSGGVFQAVRQMQYSHEVYQKARRSRDPRFDGKFFVAVKTTGIYCRPICPATTPREENVIYFASALEAANEGYRPCLRCRPDSAPHSPAWNGVNTTLDRALKLIDQGALQNQSLDELATRLGVGSRYLRQLFQKSLGVSPKSYESYQKCLFAKKLLHQTQLPITEVAMASGFNSIRRFNDCFRSQLKLSPSQLRKLGKKSTSSIELQLSYRPPYAWEFVRDFFKARLIPGLEWCDEKSYGRHFNWGDLQGSFTAEHIEHGNLFNISIDISDASQLRAVVNNIRRLLDLDVDIQSVDSCLAEQFTDTDVYTEGARIPGVWNVFEAGVRAILGQQISVKAAHTLCKTLIHELGVQAENKLFFPTPKSLSESALAFLKVPASRKNTLKNFAQHFLDAPDPEICSDWIDIKGIGPWTIAYAKLRGQSEPDIFLATDIGVINATQSLKQTIDPEATKPWRSYLTLQLWNQL